MRIMSDREKREAREAYVADTALSVAALAGRYHVSETQMLRALTGVLRPRGGRETARLTTTQMRKLADAGLTYEEIGRQAGITKSGVSRRLTRAMEREKAG